MTSINHPAGADRAGCLHLIVLTLLFLSTLLTSGCTSSRVLGVYDDDVHAISKIADQSSHGATYIKTRDTLAWMFVNNLRFDTTTMAVEAETAPWRRVQKEFVGRMSDVEAGKAVFLPTSTVADISITSFDHDRGAADGFTTGAVIGGILGGLLGLAVANMCLWEPCPSVSAGENLRGLAVGAASGALVIGLPFGVIGGAAGHRAKTHYKFRSRKPVQPTVTVRVDL